MLYIDNKGIWIPRKVVWKMFLESLKGWVKLDTILNKETNDTYYYVNGKYIWHSFVKGNTNG